MISIVMGEKCKISRREKGITLIALVVTIIVLLILAGVSIQMLTGQNGILKRTKEAKEKTEIAELKENIELEIMDEIVENNGRSIDKSKLREILVRYFGEEQVPAENDTKWDKFPEGFIFKTEEGYEIDIAEIYDESLGKMAAGTETTVPEGKEWKDTVTPTADGEGNVIPVPKGFYYAGGTKDTGFVISDVEGDDLNNNAGGNQFVWVPCSGQNGEVKYQQDSSLWINNENYKAKQYWYTSEGYGENGVEIPADKWIDNCGGDADTKEKDTISVNTYGGFYVGRFEAGLPNELSGINNNGSYANVTVNNNKIIDNGRNITTYKPVSKKNNPSWNFVNQETSKTISENMYKENDYVTSQLINGYAWDTIVEWMQTGPGAIKSASESKTYGNYPNNTISIPSGGFYAFHILECATDGKLVELVANKYSVGPWTRNVVAETDEEIKAGNIDQYISKYKSWNRWSMISNLNLSEFDRDDFKFDTNIYIGRVEIATGATESTKIKNIYDMAGNMWEWTTEISTNGRVTSSDNTPYAVRRGGCFIYNEYPLAARAGGDSNLSFFTQNIGFRVVLYVK